MSETSQPAAADGAAPAAPAKKSRAKLFIILGVVVLLLGGGGAAAYFVMAKPAATEEGEHAAKEEAHESPKGVIGFEPFVVNLADADARRFLRINVKLLVPEEEQAKHIEEDAVAVSRLRAEILDQLTQQTSATITTPEGKAALKKTIAEKAAAIVEHTEVADVLFSDFVVQY